MSLMTMELVKLWELLVASFLCLTLLTDPTAACTCAVETPQDVYCRSPIVLKAQVQSSRSDRQNFQKKYKITVTEVLKGPKTVKRFRYLHTSLEDFLCGYKHPTPFNDDEYLFTVTRVKNVLSTTSCDFNRKWDDLSEEDQKDFEGSFVGSCDY